jgi:hypothetical protein
MLFEWLRDRWKEQAHSEIVSLKKNEIMNLTCCYLKDSFLPFLYDPLPRGLSASPPAASSTGAIVRFKKKIIHGAPVRKTP